MLKVRDVMQKNFGKLDVNSTIKEAVQLYRNHRVVCAPVLDRGKTVGIVTIWEIVGKLSENFSFNQPVREIMDTDIEKYWVREEEEFRNIQDYPLERLLVHDKSGNLSGILTRLELIRIVYDALESKMAELSLVQELNMELNSVIESYEDGIALVSNTGTVLRCNEQFMRYCNLDLTDNKDRLLLQDLSLFQDKNALKAHFQEVVLSGQPQTVFRQVSGRDLLLMARPIKSGNRINKVVFTIRDMTELNSLKNRLRKMETEQQKVLQEAEALRFRVARLDGIVAYSPAMLRVLEQALRIAGVDSTVLITGPSGVGKEVIAKIIHNYSSRKDKPFIRINCGAIPENLLESELFGYEKGAFTGANKEGKLGLFELANHGTILLDEIGELPMSLQVKLLRVLQEQTITRIGGAKPVKLDVRILAATNKNLPEMVREGRFREDLFYRLNVVPLNIPPLNKRKEEIVPLINFFLKQFNKKYKLQKKISPEVVEVLEEYHWPGNVRELENMIERLVVMTDEETIGLRALPNYLFAKRQSQRDNGETLHFTLADNMDLKSATEVFEKQLIHMAMKKHKTVRKAAKALGVSHSTVLRKIKVE